MPHEVPASPISRRALIQTTGTLAIASIVPGKVAALAPHSVDSLAFASLSEVARLLRSRALSPVELTQLMLDRISVLDSKLKCFATITPDLAMSAARKAEQELFSGTDRGPLHGIPIALKDLFYTRGIRTMGGMAVRSNFVPDFDGTVVSRLAESGAVSLGKLNLSEAALGGYHPDFDIPVNPWDDSYWSGVSSSGSAAAVASGLCFAALGTDTGGSIRFPSMANGIVGLKPTYGMVSRHGVLPLSQSLDHVGPMARSVRDVAAMFQVIAGADANDATTLSGPVPELTKSFSDNLTGLRIGFDGRHASEGLNPELATTIKSVISHLEILGAEIVEVDLEQDWGNVRQTWYDICSYEASEHHSYTFPSRANEYGPRMRGFLEYGSSLSAEDYQVALARRVELNRQFGAVLSSVDAVVAPAGMTFPVSKEDLYGDPDVFVDYDQRVREILKFTFPAGLAGTPALTLPCGYTREGIPLGLQIMGRECSEAVLCRIGQAYESSTEWHLRHPPSAIPSA